MKHLFFLLIIVISLSSCSNKKLETTEVVDSISTDTTSLAAAVQLAFSPLDNYFLKNTAQLPDSVNFLIIANQSEFDNLFSVAKIAGNEITPPDFIINHTIAITTSPTNIKTTIEVEKVELGESTINVFAKITKGEKESAIATPAKVYAVEKRDGVTGMDFYLDGKMVKSLMLPSF
ncbi:MAG TPA: hypothetical protein VIT44_07100 [Cyclobacteriaceae bacterium]